MPLTAMYDDMLVCVPETAYTLNGFRAWASSAGFPSRGRVTYVQHEVLLDMSPERFESHNQVKSEICRVLGNLVVDLDLGKLCHDGLWITNDAADLSNEADGTFFSWDSMERGLVCLIESDDGDGIEMRGSPDWVLEVVSKTSERKDTVLLREAYHRAHVREYWLIDARADQLAFSLLVWRPDGLKQVESDKDGWYASEVFDRSFRLDRTRDRVGGWKYSLLVRPAW